MTPAQLSRTIRQVLCRALPDDHGSARDVRGLQEVRVVVESPPRRGGGDYATGAAFQAAARSGRTPREVAELVCRELSRPALPVPPPNLGHPSHSADYLGHPSHAADATEFSGSCGPACPAEGARGGSIAEARVVGDGFVNVTLTGAGRAALVRSLVAGRPGGVPGPAAELGLDAEPTDTPGRDIPRWAELTGESPASLAVRTERASSLFRVQYAHARCCAWLRNGRRLGIRPAAREIGAEPLAPAGRTLLALLADCARITAPGPLARHLDAVAGAFGVFESACVPLPRGEEKPGAAHRGRLALAEATGAVLAGGLSRLGVTAPAHL